MRFTDAAQKYAKRFAFICCLKVCNRKMHLPLLAHKSCDALTTLPAAAFAVSLVTLPLTPCRFDGFFFAVAFPHCVKNQ